MASKIQDNGQQRISFLNGKIKNKPGMDYVDFYKHQTTMKSLK